MASSPKTIKEVMKLPENAICADCNSKDPDWTSINLGIFICIECAGIHRNLGVHHSKVRSLELDTNCWDEDQIKFMVSIGNIRSREQYEFYAPTFYMRPDESKSPIVRENWIRAKYVKKEFFKGDGKAPSPSPCVFSMPEPPRQGWMDKQNDREKWQKRYFVLFGRSLSYFKAPSDNAPKGRLDVSGVTLKVPETPQSDRRFEFQICTSDRNLTVAAPTWEDMFNWIHAIRRAQIFYDKVGSKSDAKSAPVAKIGVKDVAKAVKAGKLKKKGDAFSMWGDKWVVLTDDALHWFKKKPEKDEEESEGGIRLSGCALVDAEEKVGKKVSFAIVAPDRNHFFQAASNGEMEEWVAVVKRALEAQNRTQEVDFKNVR